jgi:hypothetical protein
MFDIHCHPVGIFDFSMYSFRERDQNRGSSSSGTIGVITPVRYNVNPVKSMNKPMRVK